MRFTVISEDGVRLGGFSFEDDVFDVSDVEDEAVGDRIRDRFRELALTGNYLAAETLLRATLIRVSSDTGVRFVRVA